MDNLFSNKFDHIFGTFLKEDTGNVLPSPGNAEIGLNDLETERQLESINSVLEGLTTTPAINPYYMLQRIKDRLKITTGLTFDDTYLAGVSGYGSVEKPLIPVDPLQAHTHSGKKVVDNGFLNKFPGDLIISFRFLKVGQLTNVHAEIKRAPQPPKAMIEEK